MATADSQVKYNHNVTDKTGLVVTHDGLKKDCQVCSQLKQEPAIRYDVGKTRFELIPGAALQELADVYTHGTKKYADRNWEKGMSYSRIFGSIMRHCWKWFRGETVDSESGLHHMAHAAWGCLAAIHYDHYKVGNDDRPRYTT